LERRPLLTKHAAIKLSGFLAAYSCEKGIYLKLNYVNLGTGGTSPPAQLF